jgi:tetratricopeptide (TPR) repeat protein
MKIDAEKGEGIDLAKQYGVRGFPTIIISNDKGEEIDRIIGYRPPEPFLKELKRIYSGKNTLPAMLEDFQQNPTKFNTLFKLAKKYESMNDPSSAKRMVNAILYAGTDSAGTAAFFSILYDAREIKDPIPLIAYADINPNSENSTAMMFVRRAGENPDLEADLYIRIINGMKDPNPSRLNGFSWRMSELEKNMDLALEKINLAIDQVTDEEQKYMFLDTKAELLWKMDRVDEAISEIEKCITYKPKDTYYNEQLEKFKKSLNS